MKSNRQFSSKFIVSVYSLQHVSAGLVIVTEHRKDNKMHGMYRIKMFGVLTAWHLSLLLATCLFIHLTVRRELQIMKIHLSLFY